MRLLFRGCIYSSLIKMFYCFYTACSTQFHFAISTMPVCLVKTIERCRVNERGSSQAQNFQGSPDLSVEARGTVNSGVGLGVGDASVGASWRSPKLPVGAALALIMTAGPSVNCGWEGFVRWAEGQFFSACKIQNQRKKCEKEIAKLICIRQLSKSSSNSSKRFRQLGCSAASVACCSRSKNASMQECKNARIPKALNLKHSHRSDRRVYQENTRKRHVWRSMSRRKQKVAR